MGQLRARILLASSLGPAEKSLSVTQDASRPQVYEDFLPCKEWSVNDDVMNLSDSSAFSIANDDGRNRGKIFLGQKIAFEESDSDVNAGAWARHFTGRVTGLRSSSDLSGGSVIAVSCNDLGWHLTSSHGNPLKVQFRGKTFQQMLQGLIDPSWGMGEVEASNSLNQKLKHGRQILVERETIQPGTRLPYIQVEPGQAPFDIIKPYAQKAGVLVNVGANGQLIFFVPKVDASALYSVSYLPASDPGHSNNNVIGAPSLTETIDGLYSEVICFSTSLLPPNQTGAPTDDPNAAYRRDTFVPPQSPLPFSRRWVVSDSEAISPKLRQNRAKWTWQMGQFNSWQYEVELAGHSQGGVFFISDELCEVVDGVNGVNGICYVQSVRRSMTLRDGSKTRMVLRKRGLLNPALQTLDYRTGGKPKKTQQ